MSFTVIRGDEVIGGVLLDARISRGLTQEEVSSGLCDRTMLSRIERGQAIPSLKLLSLLCDRLSLSLGGVVLQHTLESNDTLSVVTHLGDLFALGDYDAVVTQGMRVLNLKHVSSNDKYCVTSMLLIARALHRSNRFERALALFERAEAIASRSHLTNEAAVAANGVASAMTELGDSERALTKYYNCYAAMDSLSDEVTKLRVTYNLSRLLRQCDMREQGKLLAERAWRLSEQTGYHEIGGHIKTLIGLYWMDLENVQLAARYFQQAWHFYTYLGDSSSLMGIEENLREVGSVPPQWPIG